jgi:histidyl-tRNA synthetase
MTFSRPKGTNDFYGAAVFRMRYIEKIIRKLCVDFNIEEIRTPVFEQTELFARGVGETTDVVSKEMYSFKDNGGRDLTLKPDGTAPTVRAYLENGLYAKTQPLKLFYVTPLFRAESPQKGRYRQYHTFGIEVLGSYSAFADAELVSAAWELFRRLGIKGLQLSVNSLGCKDCRVNYNETLKRFLGDNIGNLCATCRERFGKNPMRVLDCKNADCRVIVKSAPSSLDVLDNECTKHFSDFQDCLTAMDIPFTINKRIVRGLDYYSRTVFEFISTDLGAQDAAGGGGRYDGLITVCGGEPTGAAGFGLGLERLMIIMEEQGLFPEYNPAVDIFIGAMSDAARVAALTLVNGLRKQGITAEFDPNGRSVKAQFKFADKIGARFAVMLGDTELESGKAAIKNMAAGETAEINIYDIDGIIKIIGG